MWSVAQQLNTKVRSNVSNVERLGKRLWEIVVLGTVNRR